MSMSNWPTQMRLNVFYVVFVWFGICCFVCDSLCLFSFFVLYKEGERERRREGERESRVGRKVGRIQEEL